ncbi:bleomycin resistance protein [Paracoccus tegillarcae]|uniref:Bleomycin resistance protein n=1 Tax=Paracoccus tegillarcae TaxID=1529068 RepID=A0A2K9EC58_9RHOB|nr:VOC family protein [Paracoccus tegillarcae]AUH32503.1 VOC family protein [Paracoccus tegillarcae]
MTATIVAEIKVSDFARSLDFYTRILPFAVAYSRPEQGFAYLTLGNSALMLDQLGLGRNFEEARGPMQPPFGRGLNLQIELDEVAPVLARLKADGLELFLPLEDRWYRRNDEDVGNRQFVVADPDGYLLRFFEDLGARPPGAGDAAGAMG